MPDAPEPALSEVEEFMPAFAPTLAMSFAHQRLRLITRRCVLRPIRCRPDLLSMPREAKGLVSLFGPAQNALLFDNNGRLIAGT